MPNSDTKTQDEQAIRACLETLKKLCETPELCFAPNSEYEPIVQHAALLNRKLKAARKRAEKSRDQNLLSQVEIRKQREGKQNGKFLPLSDACVEAPSRSEAIAEQSTATLAQSRTCYTCKRKYGVLDGFYDCLCPDCAKLNFSKRSQSADLANRTALITGGRIKIGFQTALILLRAGARVLVTSRFPADTLHRYMQEEDHEDWLERLTIFSADFRYLPTVDAMCSQILNQVSRIDILINNAAQTVRRPPEYYRHLLEKETTFRKQFDSRALARIDSKPLNSECTTPSRRVAGTEHSEVSASGLHIASLLSQQAWLATDGRHSAYEFPNDKYDVDGQQVDKRAGNSWVADLEEVPLPELLEVHAVNALVPFLLIQRFTPLLKATTDFAFVVNVSAMEGHFTSGRKTGFHPHTNMAKASMNMITRTCSERLAQQKIYMNSVDTGWVTNEYPFAKVEQMQDRGFEPPLDEIDGAARVLDPIFTAMNANEIHFGKFFKDYKVAPW